VIIRRHAMPDRRMLMCFVGNLGFAFDGRELHVHLLIDGPGQKLQHQSYADFRKKRNRRQAANRQKPATRAHYNAWKRGWEKRRRDAREDAQP
jgi:hypothetical protein